MSHNDLDRQLSNLCAPTPAPYLQSRILAATPAVTGRNDMLRRFAKLAALAVICIGVLGLADLAYGPSEADMWQYAAVDSGFGDVYDWTAGYR